MRRCKDLLVAAILAAGMMSHAITANAEGDVARDVRTDMHDADKDADRAGHDIDKESKHLEKERHKGDRHVDKEVKKDI